MTRVTERVRLPSGHGLRIRPQGPDDRERVVVAVSRLSDESRYRRFHNSLDEIPASLLDQLLDVDHHRSEVLVAVSTVDDEIVGGARFTRDPDDPGTADLAVLVIDEWQQRGVATLLLRRLAQRASEEGVLRFTAVILAENRPVLDLVHRLGPADLTRDGTTVTARMEIGEWPAADTDTDTDADMDVLSELLARGEVTLLTRMAQTWLDHSAALAQTILIPVSTILRWVPTGRKHDPDIGLSTTGETRDKG